MFISVSALLSMSVPTTINGLLIVLSSTPSKLGSSPPTLSTTPAGPGHAGYSHDASGCAGDSGEFGENKNPRWIE